MRPAPAQNTVSEELALNNNKNGRLVMEEIKSGIQSDPGAGQIKR